MHVDRDYKICVCMYGVGNRFNFEEIKKKPGKGLVTLEIQNVGRILQLFFSSCTTTVKEVKDK